MAVSLGRKTLPPSSSMRHAILVVEGEAEYAAIPVLLRSRGIETGRPIIYRGQGVDCTISVLVERKLLRPTLAAFEKRCGRVVVVIDRERRPDCPGDFAQRVANELRRQLRARAGYDGEPPVSVVCADRCLENWLLADPEAFGGHAYIVRSVVKRVGNNADGIDAIGIIKWAFRRGKQYDKVRDAPTFAANVRAELPVARGRSRSLNKFLKELGL